MRACVLVATEGVADFGGLPCVKPKAHHCYHVRRGLVRAKRCSGKYLVCKMRELYGVREIATFGGSEGEYGMDKENDKVAFTLSSKQEAQLLGRVLGLSMPKKSGDTCEVEGHL